MYGALVHHHHSKQHAAVAVGGSNSDLPSRLPARGQRALLLVRELVKLPSSGIPGCRQGGSHGATSGPPGKRPDGRPGVLVCAGSVPDHFSACLSRLDDQHVKCARDPLVPVFVGSGYRVEQASIALLLRACGLRSPREVVGELFAHRVTDFTGPDGVVWTQAEEPVADGGVVIDVVAAGVSYADLLQTTGGVPAEVPVPFTPGMDAAGVVRSAPPGWLGRGPARCGTCVVWLLAGGRQRAGRAGPAAAGGHELRGRRGGSPQLPDRPVRVGPAWAGSSW